MPILIQAYLLAAKGQQKPFSVAFASVPKELFISCYRVTPERPPSHVAHQQVSLQPRNVEGAVYVYTGKRRDEEMEG